MQRRFDLHNLTVSCCYTDRCCQDRKLINEAFPDMTFCDLPNGCLALDDVVLLDDVLCVRSAAAAASACAALTNDIEESPLVAVDSEWTVGHDYSDLPYSIDVIQLACNGHVYVFHVAAIGSIPPRLKDLLQRDDITLVGRNLGGDMRRLLDSRVMVTAPQQDVADLAFELGLIAHRNTSLSRICSLAYGKELDKSLQQSNWRSALDNEHLAYAALDAAVCLHLHSLLSALQKTTKLLPDLPISVPFDNGDVTGYIRGEGDTVGTAKMALIEANGSRLQFETLHDVPVGDIDLQSRRVDIMDSTCRVRLASGTAKTVTCQNGDVYVHVNIDARYRAAVDKRKSQASDELEILEMGDQLWPLSQVREQLVLPGSLLDAEGEMVGSSLEVWMLERVKLDVFHAMNRIARTLSSTHGAFRTFMSCFKEAFFCLDSSELDEVRTALQTSKDGSFDIEPDLLRKAHLLHKRLKRVIPAPLKLKERLQAVFAVFRDIRDARKGNVFFSAATEDAIKNLLEHVEKGCLSDAPDSVLYYEDRNGRLRCARGSSSLEG